MQWWFVTNKTGFSLIFAIWNTIWVYLPSFKPVGYEHEDWHKSFLQKEKMLHKWTRQWFRNTPITHCSNPGTFLTTNIEAKLSGGKNELPHDINALQTDTFIRRTRGVNDVFVSPCQTAEISFGCVVFTSQVLQLIRYFRNSRVILQYINMLLSQKAHTETYV